MHIKILALFSFLLAFLLVSCSPQGSNVIVSEFGNHKITLKEFENAYAKNAGPEAVKKDSIQQLKNFLDLYTDFRMKLRDAEVRGYDQDTSLQNELKDYKNKIGVSFLLNKEIVEPGIKDLYQKRKYEIRISHIMIRPDSTGDSGAKKLASAILDSIKNGASFEEMAKRHSQDVYSRMEGGDVYYITAGILPKALDAIEDAAYATEPGHVYPHLVKTQYGYHIIKVTDKRARIPEIRASHILIRFGNNGGKIDTVASRAKIDSILAKIKNGADFAEMAKEYSEDPGSKNNGGDLGFFARRQMVKEFDEAAFNLKVGEVSGVVRTRYGYHLIKLTDEKKIPSFDEDKENLKSIFQKTRYQEKYDSLITNLKSKYDFKIIGKTLDYIASKSDSAVVGNDSALIADTKGMPLYSFTGNTKDASAFLSNINNDQQYTGKLINLNLLRTAINKSGEEALLEKEAAGMENTDSAFNALIKDYRAGIYIFKLQTDEVWNKISIDSTRLHSFYDSTKENYKWPDRVSYEYIAFTKDSAANDAYNKLQKGLEFDSLGERINRVKDLQAVSSSKLAQKAFELEKTGDFSKPFNFNNTFYIIKLTEKSPSHIKSFEEAKPEISSELQDKEAKNLENDYIQRLKNLYKPVYHYDELTKAFKNA